MSVLGCLVFARPPGVLQQVVEEKRDGGEALHWPDHQL
jgi:hypothetical protein